jgi:flagellin-like hook-associated protein FlgL
VSTQIFLSNVQDLDFAEAVTRMQAAEIQLQASLQTAGRLLNVSLMDFLR